MPPFRSARHSIATAVAIGLAAVFINRVLALAFPALAAPLGNLLVLICAMTLGVSGATISVAIGVIPEALLTNQHLYGVRWVILATTLGWVMQRYPRFPAFLVTTILWACVFGPATMIMQANGSNAEFWSAQQLIFTAVSDTLFTLASSALLFHPTIWTYLSAKPRHLSLSTVVLTSMAILVVSAAAGGLLLAGNSAATYGMSPAMNPVALVCYLLVGICFAVIVAQFLASTIVNNYSEFVSPSLLSKRRSSTFSGLSSDFWRRQRDNRGSAPDNGSSSGNQRVPTEIKESFVSLDQGICALNRNGTITFANRKFRRVTETSMNDIIGLNIDAVNMRPEMKAHIVKLLERTFKRGPRTTELKLNNLPDKLRFYEIASQQAAGNANSSIGDGPDSAIITVKDISDRRAVESHLLQGQKLGSLGNVVRGVAHAFNNSLTTIVGQVSFAQRTNETSQIKAALEATLSAATIAGDLVRKLLDFAEGRPSFMKTEDFAEVIEHHLELLHKIVGEECEISFHNPPNPIGVSCDTNLIVQAITNLVLNSREAYKDGRGQIAITLDTEHLDEEVSDLHVGAQPGDFARLRVKDSGYGMNPEVLSHAFDPLFTTKASSGHTGLGLSIVYAIVRAHDGFLSAESHPERGTTVSLYLPLRSLADRPAKAESARPKTAEQKGAQKASPLGDLLGQKEKILVVEDEPAVRDLVARMLSTLNYTVLSCANAREALETCAKSPFDLILVDMVMPRMDGAEFVKALRGSGSDAKTLVMTGYGVTPESSKISAHVLPKPFDIEALAKAVRKALANEQAAA